MERRALLLGLAALAACGPADNVWDPAEAVARARYRHPGAASLTLVTVRNAGDGSGAHTGLLISASERVLFDPAGTWRHPSIPEQQDVLYGMTPEALELYLSYHARESFLVVTQAVDVPPQVAEAALVRAKGYGAVGQARCTSATSDILADLPGFEGVSRTFFPNSLATRFGRLPGVVTAERREGDADDGRDALLAGYGDLPAPPLPEAPTSPAP